MDLASVVAALASVGVRVSGSTPNNNVQGDSSRACPTGLAGPEPSGTNIDPGQHFHGSRGYLNVVPLVSQPQLAPQYGPVDSAAPGEVTITLPWCCASEALKGMPCASPSCPRRAQISSCGDPNHPNPSRNWPSSSWNLPAYADGHAPPELTDLAGTNTPYQCPHFETIDADIDDIEMGGPGEVPTYNRPASWAQWDNHLSSEVTRNLQSLEALCLLATSKLIGQERIASDFLFEYFFLLQEEINTRMWWRSQEDDYFAIFLQIWEASPFPKEKTKAPVAGPSAPHPPVSIRDDLAAAVEEGILEAARQASLEGRAEGSLQVDSWLRTTEISGPTACSGPSGHGMYCPADCSCRSQRDTELQLLKDKMQLIIQTLGIKDLFKTHMRSEGASSVEQATEPSEESTEIFSIAPLVDSKTTDARISRTKLKERVTISRSQSRTAKARTEAQNAKRTASRTAPPAADSNALAQLLLAQTLAGAGVANDAAKVSAITAGVGLDSLLNPTSLRLRQVAKQPKYNGNPRRWPQFQRDFKLWVKTQKLQDDQFLMALLDCLEGAPAITWLRTWSDREDSSSPLSFDEVWGQLEVRGSRLPEDHYHKMLKNFPSFSRLILHEVPDKRQRFWNLVEESERSGEKFSSAELKNLIFDKIPSETAATLRNKQSEEKVKTWWAEVEGFDASANRFSVRESLQKCSPTSFTKVKFTENTWKIKFNEHEDRDLFVQVLNRGVSFHGHRLKARKWVFSFTPQELWEEVERLADAANQNFHEGLGGNKNTQQNTQNGAQKGNKKVNDTRNVQDHCSICLLLGSTNRAKTHSTGNHRWSPYDHKVIGENISNPQNSDRNDRQVHGGKGGKGNSPPSGGNKNTGGPGGSQGTGNWTPSGSGGQPNGQKSPNGNAGGGNRNPGQTPQSGTNKGNAPGSQGKGKGNPSGTPSSGKGRGRGDGGGPSSGGRGRGRGKGNHRVDQVSGADQVSDADRDYVENGLNPADDPFQEEWVDESGYVRNVNANTGGQNA